MLTVTVAATYGARGSVIAPALAKRPRPPFIDPAIPLAVAGGVHQPPQAPPCHDPDRARHAYVQHFSPRAGAGHAPRNYQVVLDSTALSHDACIDIIVRAAQDFFSRSK